MQRSIQLWQIFHSQIERERIIILLSGVSKCWHQSTMETRVESNARSERRSCFQPTWMQIFQAQEDMSYPDIHAKLCHLLVWIKQWTIPAYYSNVLYHLNERMKDANIAITLREKWPEKISGSEQDLNPRPLRYRCNALPTELSKPHESSHVWVRPYMFSGRNTRLKHMNSMVIDVQQ